MMNSPMDPQVGRVLDTPDVQVDTERALSRMRERIEREHVRAVVIPARSVRGRWDGALSSMWAKATASIAAVAIALTLLTVTGVAETIITLFEPKTVVPVSITANDIQTGMAGWARYGTLTWSQPPRPYDVPNVATASSEAGFKVLVPSQLPSGVSVSTARYGVMPRTTATFTFSAALAQQSAQSVNRTPPPMPANIDGSKLFVTGGPAVVQYFEDGTAPKSSTGENPFASLPKLVVAQGIAPVVQSDGVTVEQLQQYLLAQPGISPSLAAQIRAIKDPSSTLPIPIPVDMASAKQISVQGVQGVFVGDSTGLGSALIWSKDGMVFGVAGTLSEAEILAVANSLH